MNSRSTETSAVTPLPALPVSGAEPLASDAFADELSASPDAACCSWAGLANRICSRGVAMPVMTGVTLLALAAAGYFAGVAAGMRNASAFTVPQSFAFPTSIDATAAATSEKYSIATGLVSEEAEGFFVLDHNSGLLQCSVFYPRVGKFLGSFTVNAGDVIGAGGKGGGYIMVTGHADMTRGGRGAQIAPTLVYVLNTASGNYASFAVPFDRQAANTGRPQQAAMIPMGTGTASVIPSR